MSVVALDGPQRKQRQPIDGERQDDAPDTGLICLVRLARLHLISAQPEQIAHEFAQSGHPLGTTEILLAAKKLGLLARHVKTHRDRLSVTPLPAIARMNDGSFCVVGRVVAESAAQPTATVLIQSPLTGPPETLSADEFAARWSGELILFASRASVLGQLSKFDFSWFIPAIVKYRKMLGEVLLASLLLQLFALVTPLFFQVVMDKVLVHRAYTTLEVIVAGLIALSLFDVALTGLRSYIFSHTATRIDVELGSRLFRHLIDLPLSYFLARRVGDSVARVRELENIRSFLTGNAITLVLDVCFSIVFLSVMLYYSVTLTLVVIVSLPCYFLVALVVTPILRARLNEKFNRGADNQALLVETISGVETLKSMAVEPQWIRKWETQLAAYVSASLRATNVGNLAHSCVTLIGKLVSAATLWFGAKAVIDTDLTVGQFIAFNMLASQVSTPIMRLAQMWSDFQQTGISVERLGDILNAHTETVGDKTAMPAIKGSIVFDKVTFRYKIGAPEVLRNLDLAIVPGEVVGVVGRSGSGKSTLAKLVQRIHVAEAGRIFIDGVDLKVVSPSSLRRQIGVVLQESVLFNRSIRENIALVDPSMPLEAVMQAAKLAGAHDFIAELTEGYDTLVGEHGASLSGGQRQRIAIARALMANPRILIFDEATSALDYESEHAIQQNMRQICKGRTVIIIAHRLSTVRICDRLLVLDRGQLVEEGTHDSLVSREGGYYAKLHRLQAG